MAKHTVNITFDVQCPKCGADGEKDLEFINADTCLINDGGAEIYEMLVFEDEEDKDLDNDSLVRWKCLACGYLFSLDTNPSWPGPRDIQKLSSRVSVHVEYGCGYVPCFISIGSRRFEIDSVTSYNLPIIGVPNSIFRSPPFGRWIVRTTLPGSVSLEINRAYNYLTNEGQEHVDASINGADHWATPKVLEAAKAAEQEHYNLLGLRLSLARNNEERNELWDSDKEREPYPPYLIQAAAFRLVIETEDVVRNAIWAALKIACGGDSEWWKSGLNEDMRKRLVDRLEGAKKRAPMLSLRVEAYVTTGELRELVSLKWDKLKDRGYTQKDHIIAAFLRFERYRNEVAHGRSFSARQYDELKEAAEELLIHIPARMC